MVGEAWDTWKTLFKCPAKKISHTFIANRRDHGERWGRLGCIFKCLDPLIKRGTDRNINYVLVKGKKSPLQAFSLLTLDLGEVHRNLTLWALRDNLVH